LPEYTVSTAIACGWAGLSDTELLDAMDGKFDALITVDKSIRHQQRLDGRTFGLVVLRAKSNRLATLRRLVPALLVTLPLIKPGEICEISE